MKYLVLENDHQLNHYFEEYLNRITQEYTFLPGASHRDSEEISEAFEQHQVLIFEPTMINSTQFLLMMMLMWNLLQEGKLGIQQVLIFHHDEDLESEIKEVFEKYQFELKELLDKVKIVQIINGFDDEQKILKLI